MEVFTLIIAVLGALTGIAALIIQFIEYKKSKVKLKMKIDEKYSYYTMGNNVYRCKYFGIVSVKLSNCSALPITLDEAYISYENEKRKHDKSLKDFNIEVPAEGGGYYHLTPFKSADLPLRIDCYDSIFVSFRFPFFDEFVGKDFNLTLITPRKKYTFKANIKDIMNFK